MLQILRIVSTHAVPQRFCSWYLKVFFFSSLDIYPFFFFFCRLQELELHLHTLLIKCISVYVYRAPFNRRKAILIRWLFLRCAYLYQALRYIKLFCLFFFFNFYKNSGWPHKYHFKLVTRLKIQSKRHKFNYAMSCVQKSTKINPFIVH